MHATKLSLTCEIQKRNSFGNFNSQDYLVVNAILDPFVAENMKTVHTNGDAGLDLISTQDGVILPKHYMSFGTGVSMELPTGLEAQIRGRSGMAFKHGVGILHGVGTVDSSYRGEIKVILMNHSDVPYEVKAGDRIAQMVIAPHFKIYLNQVEALSDTERGESGFGSTGR